MILPSQSCSYYLIRVVTIGFIDSSYVVNESDEVIEIRFGAINGNLSLSGEVSVELSILNGSAHCK